MLGKNKHLYYTDRLLRENCAAPGLTVLMTPPYFMTKEACIAATPGVVSGLRSSDTIFASNPQWRMTGVVYGFVPRTLPIKAIQLRVVTNIQSIKEEGYSLYSNQAYDKYVAVQDKSANK